jgi:membrane protease YdiL (CAAX protease family)
VVVVMLLFNTVRGEELLFRGLLLPRMSRAFGRADWLINGVLFALYHLHMPWVIPAGVLDAFWFAWPTKYFRSAWIGIVVHSTASVLILVLLLPVVWAPRG